MHGDVLISPPLPLPCTLSRLSSPPLPSIRNSFRRPPPPPTPSPHSAKPLALKAQADEHTLECTSLKFSCPIPTCNAEEAIQSARHTSSSIPFKSPIVRQASAPEPCLSLPTDPWFFFLSPPPPTRPGQTGLPGELKRSRSHLALPSWPGFSPPLLPGPHTTHGIFTSMDVPTTQAQTSGGGAPLPPPACPQASSSSRAFESRGGQGAAGGGEGAIVDHLYLPANPSPIFKINPSLCEPESGSHHTGPQLCRGCKERRGVGSEPLPRRAGGASATWPQSDFAREEGAGGRSSWRCEKREKMPKLAPFILLATFLTHDNNFHLYLSRECEKRALHHRALVPRGCRITRPGGLGPHLRSEQEPSRSPGRRALPLPPGMSGPQRPRGPGGSPWPRKGGKWDWSTCKSQEAEWMGGWRWRMWWLSWVGMPPWLPRSKGQKPSKAPGRGWGWGTHYCPSASSPTVEGMSKIITHV